jgi:D-citramalate synthase
VFTQTAGIHADGDNKNNLYFNDLPKRFEKEQYALGKTSGNRKEPSRIRTKTKSEDLKLVTQRIIELGDKRKQLQRRLTHHI